MKPLIHVVTLPQWPIYDQLRLEEALLRADNRNWCLFNEGSPHAIVMGISGKEELLINATLLKQRPVPVIRRFSGGGTVFVDNDTVFVTLICNSPELNLKPYPEHVLRWTEQFYKPIFSPHDFKLIENDYVIGTQKFGGNAQYFCKQRWLHHSTLLWDFQSAHMEYLLYPTKTPKYRQQRPHTEFLCRLRDYYPNRNHLKNGLWLTLQQHFVVKEVPIDQMLELLERPHRKATEELKI